MLAIGVHFPKAGGNSLLVALRRRYGETLLLDYADDPALPQAQVRIDPYRYMMRRDEIGDNVACVFGHFNPVKFSHLKALRFTVLREPVRNMISIYVYLKAVKPSPAGLLHQYIIREGLDVLETARLTPLRHLMSHTYFGAVDMRSFDYIGSHEHREATNARLCQMLGLEPFDEIRVNVTPESEERYRLEDDPRIIAQLTDILSDDRKFYERWAP